MNEELVKQATKVADRYMKNAVEKINARFGQGFAEQNPNLIGAFMISVAISVSAEGSSEGLKKLSESIKYQ